ncbi:hypothetical protein SCHPADRAFT_948089 [Schizopora paradoxa]|uniref:Uncharacterized protein n=1 Tax=Schizopora paradoxa TaxID=27342 RepID=A0A0H2RGE4_9AGAM|nr:hypothetical protein SCHPADRAFT_948089 [Schizopora paradoxa]
MACLNLPVDIRYKPENMYIACIIPGPKEPHLTQSNHFIRPLVDDLKASWERGTQFSHNPTRTVRSALACAVCDLVGARKLSCSAGVTSNHICTVCDCSGRGDYGRTDYDHWKTKERATTLEAATEWRDARSTSAQTKLFSKNGVRWCELWRLPYWDPAKQLVIDPMHCLLEGLAQGHFRFVLGLTNAEAKAKPAPLPAFRYEFPIVPNREDEPSHPIFDEKNELFMKDKEVGQISQIYGILQEQIKDGELAKVGKKLQRKNRASLEYACRSLELLPTAKELAQQRGRKSKEFWVEKLLAWRKEKPFLSNEDPELKLCTPELLELIREVVQETETPSWFGSVPYNFGDPNAGSLKADEWRSFSTVYLPFALVKAWGSRSTHARVSTADALRRALDHTMLLVQAITLACYRQTSRDRALAYQSCISKYLEGLLLSYPSNRKIRFKPNSHAAMHIYDFLLLFGAVHSWWTFPFERLVGVLQRLKSNHKPGEFESTLLKAFIRNARLRQWMSRPDIPEAIRTCAKIFDRLFGRTDYTRGEEDELAEEEFLIDSQGKSIARVKHRGITYSKSSAHVGNSLVLFYPNGDLSQVPVPGQISDIAWTGSTTELRVRRQSPIIHEADVPDPFDSYPHLNARLYRNELESDSEIIRLDWVTAHYARYQWSASEVAVLSLSRVNCSVSRS